MRCGLTPYLCEWFRDLIILTSSADDVENNMSTCVLFLDVTSSDSNVIGRGTVKFKCQLSPLDVVCVWSCQNIWNL